jgi:E3 ubiquitin-protein ligase NEDD4
VKHDYRGRQRILACGWLPVSHATSRSTDSSYSFSTRPERKAKKKHTRQKSEDRGLLSAASNGGAGGPGASAVNGSTTVFRVTVPDNVEPGQEFQVYAGNRIVRVKCPPNIKAGQSLQITVPSDASDNNMPPDSSNVQKVDNNGIGPQAYMITIPDGVLSGQQFPVTIQGQQLMVTCPTNAGPGVKVRIVPPPPPTDVTEGPQDPMGQPRPKAPPNDDQTQLFEVLVPAGVNPGSPFALLAGGVRVLVTCPANAGPGQRIRFKLPLALTQKHEPQSEAAAIKLSYDKDGWTRTIRVSDMKFQWVRMDDNGDVDTNTRFNAEKSAYVRKLEFRAGNDSRVRDGVLTLVPAEDVFCDSRIKGPDDEDLVTYSELAEAQVKSFEDKCAWFQEKCAAFCVEWNEGHMRMNVRREFLLEDSVDAVMSLSRKDLRKLWRFEFIGEVGIDAGGLAREWFQLVTSEIFDPDMGLWQSSESNQMCMAINPASSKWLTRFVRNDTGCLDAASAVDHVPNNGRSLLALFHAEYVCDDYLVYYRFLGRVMGKALFDRQLVAGHTVQYIYKHMLGWPIQFKDIEYIDEEYYGNLKKLKDLADMGEDLSMMCLDFSITQEVMGAKEDIDLIENGSDVEVTNDNFPEYLEACMRHRMLEHVKPQLSELLLGFYDVIPEPLLTIFDFQELELLMCGLPNINMQDWKDNTEYSGDYEHTGISHPACEWFWEVVEEFDQEMRARLLQFVTGTSGVPSRGFGVLQGNDGNVRHFTIHGISVDFCLYPRAHTCFNRIDLPKYESKDELREKLKLAVTMVSTGFDIE